MRPAGPTARDLLWAVSGPALWAVAFVLLYAGVSLGCRSPLAGAVVLGADALTIVLAAVLALHLAGFGRLIATSRRVVAHADAGPASTGAFLTRVRLMGAVAGAVATLCVGAPVLFLENCV